MANLGENSSVKNRTHVTTLLKIKVFFFETLNFYSVYDAAVTSAEAAKIFTGRDI